MNRSLRIAYAWEWGTGAGHLSRFEPLARDLVDDGHFLVLMVRDLTLVRNVFPWSEWSGKIEVRQAPTPIQPPANLRKRPTTFAELAWNLGYGNSDRVLATIEAWHGMLIDTRCDCLISDFGLGAVVAAQCLQLPTIRLGTGFECPPPHSPLASLNLSHACDRDASIEALQQVRQHVDNAIQMIAGPGRGRSYQASIEDVPQMIASVPELEHYDATRPIDSYIGNWPTKHANFDPVTSKGDRVCFAYLKKSPHVQPLMSSLHREGWNCILTGPAATVPISDPAVESSIQRCPNLINIEAVASKTDFGITNANHGTTLQLLRLGVPVLAVPLFIEQFVTAHNLAKHQLGVSLIRCSEVEIQHAIATIMAEAIGAACKQFATDNESLLQSSKQTAISRLRNWLDHLG